MTRLEFPYPPPQLMPNFKRSHHWSRYNKLARNARTLGWGLTVQQKAAGCCRGIADRETIEIKIEITPPMRRGPVADEDNLKGALKHYLDGIADALGINDSRFRFAPIVWHKKRASGEVAISF